MESQFKIFQPGDLSESEICECIFIIKEGGAVEIDTAKRQISSATVAVKCVEGKFKAVGAIKKKRADYDAKISKRSGFPMSLTARELDYVAVMKSYRGNGVSHEIIAKLLSNFQSRPIFATTSNDAMKNTLSRAGFVQQGTEWQGTNGQLSLWIKS